MFRKRNKQPVTPVVHDFRDHTKGVGHDAWGKITQNSKGQREIALTGFGFGNDGRQIKEGDYLLLGRGEGGSWCVTAISYQPNPHDMWDATVIRKDLS